MPHLSWNEVRDRATRFSRDPHNQNATSESGHKQTFWNDFFQVFGLRRASFASFEENVRNLHGNTSRIDLLWKGKLIVEHKSRGENLGLAASQAFTYIEDLTREDRWDEIPRYVLVSDFGQFVLYDLEPEDQPDLLLFAGRKIEQHHFTLQDFPKHVRHFAFMLGQTRVRYKPEDAANEKAYDRMCQLHDELQSGGFTGHELERLLVRTLFCLFAEDNGIFGPEAFTSFIRTQTRADGSDLGQQLQHLFEVLDTPTAERQAGLDEELAAFPYVNGKLFTERLRTPIFRKPMRDSLLFCCDFQWARISPAVFGSLFQGIMEDRARRQQGAHYTSERDIMKVVHSLFLDGLKTDWKRLQADRSTRRRAGMEEFQQKLRSLHFLDPACGCGNFLVLAYRELRALEIEVVSELHVGTFGTGERHAAQTFRTEDFANLFGVNVDQFHGIEIGEWPVRIAEVAMWLMDNQMNQNAATVLGEPVQRLPLRATPHIVHANALQLDWNSVLPAAQCSYVLGNPPFIGKKEQNAEQKGDMARIWGGVKGAGVLDYVTAWYLKAAQYISGRVGVSPAVPGVPPGATDREWMTQDASSGGRDAHPTRNIFVAFVSTNSISQGEQVGILWNELFQRWHIKIHFAHRTFAWMSEARGKAHVHVVIIGFGAFDRAGKHIYEYDHSDVGPVAVAAHNINAYLLDGPDVSVEKRMHPLSDVPKMDFGSKAADFGHLVLSAAESAHLIDQYPMALSWIRPFLGSEEFINGKDRFCLWLKGANPSEIRKCPPVLERLEKCRAERLKSVDPNTRRWADSPALFQADRQPETDYLVVPKVSSEKRRYIPLGFVPPQYITNPSILVVPGATLYHFGVLSALMHMAWTRQVGGRMKSDYQYSNTIVYNNFPWPNPTPAQRSAVETCAQAVLSAREPHLPPRGLSTLADLYDPLSMPPELAKAHAALDRAVEKCYRPEPFHSDRERVEHLFRLYETLTAPLLPAAPTPRQRRTPSAARVPASRRVRTPGLPSNE